MTKWLSLLLSSLALGLVVAGCGGDDEDDEGGRAETTQQPATTGADTGRGSRGTGGPTVAVGMKDIQFVPQDVKVKAGGKVKWTNSDSVTHTVTKESGPGARFDSGNLEIGATFEQKFSRRGRIDYVCTIHPNQSGTVTVE